MKKRWISPVGFPYQTQTQTVITTTAAFSANQVIGTGINNFPVVPNSGFIQSVQINLNSTNANQIDFCAFTSSMPNTTFTDHSSIAISSLDFASQGPVVNITNWNYMGTAASNGLASGLANTFYSGNQIMYWALVARGAVTVNSTNGVSVSVTYVS
jgi:hypothetical protein